MTRKAGAVRRTKLRRRERKRGERSRYLHHGDIEKLEALDGHIEGWSNAIGTYDIKVNTLESQVASFVTIVKNNEGLIRVLLETIKQSETNTAGVGKRRAELGTRTRHFLK
jgi:hypothetical protein